MQSSYTSSCRMAMERTGRRAGSLTHVRRNSLGCRAISMGRSNFRQLTQGCNVDDSLYDKTAVMMSSTCSLMKATCSGRVQASTSSNDLRCRTACRASPRAELAMSSVPVRIYGKHMKLTDSIRTHAEEKVAHAVRNYTNMVSHVEVNLSVKGHAAKGAEEHKAEVTVYTRHHGLIRAEERSSEQGNIYEAIDLVSDKLVRALRRTKEKKQRRERRAGVGKKVESGVAGIRANRNAMMEEQIELEIERSHVNRVAPSSSANPERNFDSVVVRVKQFDMPPMTVSDAIEAVENIDHDWYLFKNSETGDMNVLYARKEGGYGLVVPSNDDEADLDTSQSIGAVRNR